MQLLIIACMIFLVSHMIIELHELLIKSADKALQLQHRDGYFPKGHDGPWNYTDTFLRTTSHWAILIAKAYNLTGKIKYKRSVINACNYLISKEARPNNYTFHCRKNSNGNDKCNGLIGQAWVLEALITVGNQLKIETYLNTARQVLEIIPYSYYDHSWITIDVDGANLGECKTLNQQIWLAYNSLNLGNITNNNHLLTISTDFFLNLHKKINFFDRGLIKHSFIHNRSWIKETGSWLIMHLKNRSAYRLQQKVSIGYLPFLLYGVAAAIENIPNAPFWKDVQLNFFISSVNYIEHNHPYGLLEGPSSYRWSYNPAGIEMAYIYQVIGKHPDIFKFKPLKAMENNNIHNWLQMQIEGYYDFNEHLMNKNTNDPIILSSRLYESTKLENVLLNIRNNGSSDH